MSITGANNPFSCTPVVFSAANQIIQLGTITRLGNVFTFSVGFKWKINGVTYQNTAPIALTIAEASDGFYRIDNAILNTSNSIELQQGLESETIALQPVVPDTNILLTSWNISGSTIGDTSDPIIGSTFKKKTESLGYSDPSLSGANAVIQLRPEGNSRYSFSNVGLVSIDGFGLDLITGNPTAEAPYDGKDLFIENTGTTPITLLHDGPGTASSKFFFTDEENLTIPAGGKVWLKYGNPYCQLFFKSWNNQTPTFQQVTDQGNVTDNEITAEAFKTPNYGSFGSIVFNNGELQQIGAMFTLADELAPAEYVFPAIGGEMATKEWIESNEFAYNSQLFEYVRKENLRQYNYDFSEPIDSIRLELPPTESYLIINTLIESINGFNVTFSDLFEGKDYFIYNNSSDEITLKHNYDNATYDFNFKAGVNIQLPRRGVIHLKFIGGKFIDVNKSWEYFNELQGVNINKGTYTGGITWTGTTAPSGTTSHTYNWQKAGNLVTLNVTLFYQNSGTALTSVVMDFMNDFPNPLKPDGLSGASEVLYNGSGDLRQTPTSTGIIPASSLLRSNASNDGFQLVITQGSISAKIAKITISYFTE
jgi:hypothetical protein